MRTHVALVRGVNVGGHNKLAMADLRDLMTSLGHTDVTTYVQSGNAVFTAAGNDAATALAHRIEAAITDRLGVRPAVVVLTRPDLARVVAENPYPGETDPTHVHVVFRNEKMTAAGIEAVAAAQQRAREGGGDDEATVIGRVVYLHTPHGSGRSRLAAELARPGSARSAHTGGTARNWATVTKLLSLLEG